METSRCKAFLTAAESGSFTKAAEILSYSPSGVSQLVTALEKELGFSLFVRHKRGISLTTNGERLLPAVREFLYREECIRQIATDIRGLTAGDVRIATYSSIASHWLPEVMRDFINDYPAINITLMEGGKSDIIRCLEEKRADIAFASNVDNMSYDWIHLDDDPLIAVLPKDHPYAEKDKYPLSECIHEDLIMSALGYDEDLLEMFSRNNLHPTPKYKTVESFAAMSMVEKSLGISIMNELITRNWKCDVAKIPLDPPEKIQFGVLVPDISTAAPAVKKFLEYAVKYLKRV